MNFLGIDYGTKRIGLAISDENGVFAFPKEIISSDKDSLNKIGGIIKEKNITDVVVGESLDFSGAKNPVEAKIDIFISELEKQFKVKIHREKEFLTSIEARKVGTNKNSFQKTQAHSKIKKVETKKADASAAALILQRFLDKVNH